MLVDLSLDLVLFLPVMWDVVVARENLVYEWHVERLEIFFLAAALLSYLVKNSPIVEGVFDFFGILVLILPPFTKELVLGPGLSIW